MLLVNINIQDGKKIQVVAFCPQKSFFVMYCIGYRQETRNRIKLLFTWIGTIFLVVNRCWKSYYSVTSVFKRISPYLTICFSCSCQIHIIQPIGSIGYKCCPLLTLSEAFDYKILIIFLGRIAVSLNKLLSEIIYLSEFLSLEHTYLIFQI